MRTEYIGYVLHIADKGSINKASTFLNFAPQKLSRILSLVEDECGYKIFERSSKGVFLTKDGELFLDKAREIMALMAEMTSPHTNMHNSPQEIVEDVDIYHIHSSPTEYFLPTVMRFTEKFPLIRLTYNETSYSHIISSVQDPDRLTIGIIANIYPAEERDNFFITMPTDLFFKPLIKTKMLALISENHPLYNRYQEISLKTLIQYPVSILQSNGNVNDSTVYNFLKNYGDPKIKYSVTNLDLYYQILRQGTSFGLAAEKNVVHNNLRKLPLHENIVCEASIVINKKYEKSYIVNEFLEDIVKSANDIIMISV